MNPLVCFHIHNEISIEDAWQELEDLECQLLYSSEDPNGAKEIYGYKNPSMDLVNCPSVINVTPASLDIDWHAQWAEHGLDFYDGLVHVDLSKFGFKKTSTPVIVMEPGPGFGDLSHPTTRLMLRIMSDLVQGQHVLDIGSGSGILTFAASVMGADSACGVDIDIQANEHAKKNAELNGMQNKISFVLPENYQPVQGDKALSILMNMIWSEQVVAWESLPQVHHIPGDRIISGILAEERDDYLAQTKKWGWTYRSELEEEGWLAFHFEQLYDS